jgi:hypothetical protein
MAIYDVTQAFDGELETITHLKAQPGSYVDGVWNDTAKPFSIMATVHPQDANKVLQNDPDALIDVDAVKIYTETLLSPGSTRGNIAPDRIIWNGKIYKIIEVKDWIRIGGFCKAIAYFEKLTEIVEVP